MEKITWKEISFNIFNLVSIEERDIKMTFDFFSSEWAIAEIEQSCIYFPKVDNLINKNTLRTSNFTEPVLITIYDNIWSQGKVMINNELYEFKNDNENTLNCYDKNLNCIIRLKGISILNYNYEVTFDKYNKIDYPILICIGLFFLITFRKRTLFI